MYALVYDALMLCRLPRSFGSWNRYTILFTTILSMNDVTIDGVWNQYNEVLAKLINEKWVMLCHTQHYVSYQTTAHSKALFCLVNVRWIHVYDVRWILFGKVHGFWWWTSEGPWLFSHKWRWFGRNTVMQHVSYTKRPPKIWFPPIGRYYYDT